MNPYQFLIPQLLAGLVIAVIALRAVRQSRRDLEVDREESAKRRERLLRELAEREKRLAEPTETPAGLLLTLDLSDEDAVSDVRFAALQAESLVTALSRHEQSLGGTGLTVTAATVQHGELRLTLSPVERLGSAERVRRVADQFNANGEQLPPGVTAAHADILAV